MTRKRIRDIRHEELIDATILAVHEFGFAQVTMAEIAHKAQSSAASINYYFGSKDSLMEATMLHLLRVLRQAMIKGYSSAGTPRARLLAVLDANFSDDLFTAPQCSLWVQFWANALYSPPLARLHRVNRSRVRSHFRAELRQLVPDPQIEITRRALQSYMDGVWLQAAQSNVPPDAAAARAEAHRFAGLLVPDNAL
jgi:TetR/AcrR family transcriptional regulator, transcriptional repressor of bet genes